MPRRRVRLRRRYGRGRLDDSPPRLDSLGVRAAGPQPLAQARRDGAARRDGSGGGASLGAGGCSMKVTGAQALFKALEGEGVDLVFGIPGGAILPAYHTLVE